MVKRSKDDTISIEMITRDLQRILYNEAKAAGKGIKNDYKKVFDFFDIDHSGIIVIDEFREALLGLHIIDELSLHLVPQLMNVNYSFFYFYYILFRLLLTFAIIYVGI
jgi:Ca2+-binding EF-hand superfamily protein